MLPHFIRCFSISLIVGSAFASGQTVVFDGQRYQSNGSVGFSPSFTIWDDLQTEFGGLASDGTLSEVSISASKQGEATQPASGFFDIRLFDEAGNRPQGVSIAQIPFNGVFGPDPNSAFGTHTLIQVSDLESMNISIPRNAKLGVGVFFDDSDDWNAVLSNSAIIGSSPGDNWLSNSPTERADGGVGDFAWRLVVAETMPEVTWVTLAGGEWDDPYGWDSGFTPQATQDVNALMVTEGPLIGPSADTTVKSINFRSFASDSTFQVQPGVEFIASEKAWFQGKGQLDVNGGTLRAPEFFGTIISFDSGLIEVSGGDFTPLLGDFLLSGSGDPTIQLNGARFQVRKQAGQFGTKPAELRLGEEEGHRGTLEATAGATLEAERAIVGWDLGSAGTLNLSGANTVATINADVTLGSASLTEGKLLVEDDAQLNAAQLVLGQYGVGHATVRGGVVNIIENDSNQGSGDIDIGGFPGPGLSNSRLLIEAGGVVNADRSVSIAGIASGSGSVVVAGSGSELNAAFSVGVGSSRPGSLQVLDGARLSAGGTVGTGLGRNLPAGEVNEVLIAGAATTAEVGGFYISSRGSLSIESGAAVTTSSITVTGGNATITGPDTLVDASTTTSSLASLWVNNGTLRIESGAEVLSAGLNVGDFNGTASTAIVTGAGTRLESNGLFFVVGNVSPGSLEVRDGATVDRTGDVIVGAADAANASLLVTGEGTRLDVNGDVYLSGGRLNDQVFDVQGPAVLRIETGATMATTGVVEPFTHSQIELAGGELIADEISLASGGTFDFAAGRLSVNDFNGDLINNGGILAPGPISQQQGVGSTAIAGDYDQNNGALEIEVGGELASSQYDLVSVTGTAFLGGDLLLALIDDYVPGPDETFTVLDATSLVGQYDNVNPGQRLATTDGLGTFQVNYGFTSAYAATELVLSDFQAGPVGDFDLDGDVDGQDFLLWQRDPIIGQLDDWKANFGATLPAGPVGDFDLDGNVNGQDFLLWQRDPNIGQLADWKANFGATLPSAADKLASVPEPLSILLLAIGLGVTGCSRTAIQLLRAPAPKITCGAGASPQV